jgi:hypothetical protein
MGRGARAPQEERELFMIKLNLGCGQNKIDGYINVDKYDSFSPEVVWDLEVIPWPFETSSADEVILHHSLEHMGATVDVFLLVMKELYRVSAPDATVIISVPHPRSEGFAGDPTHVRPVTPTILSLFSKKKNLEWKQLGWPNTPLATYIDVDFDITAINLSLMPHWAGQLNSGKIDRKALDFAMDSYFNVVDEIKVTLKVCK